MQEMMKNEGAKRTMAGGKGGGGRGVSEEKREDGFNPIHTRGGCFPPPSQ